ncbi:3-oxoacyl-[acyl-carrier protein] reductase [Euzebya pacifica]|uniref:3-oxoacyl-[acyl-carrier protein] reductase n=1 Tax=Euzebya pacifica TaxID=1608957 RepID=A0A346XWX6_9ACTN|nr:3-oxoacyl-[acyl-carrier protein] reductase [Euzebya pacifica]
MESTRHPNLLGIECDVADADALIAAVARVTARFGPSTVGVANAGIQRDARVGHMRAADWDEVIRVDLTAGFRLTQALWAAMSSAGTGRMVYLSSVAKDGNFGQANYAAAKAGLVGLARTVAIEGGPAGITANVVCPGVIDTPGTAEFKQRAPAAYERFISGVPARRAGTPTDVAGVIDFLCSPAAAYVSGQTIYVDGGLSCGHN